MPVNQAAPILKHTLLDLLSDMRSRAQVVASMAERIPLTRDIALFSSKFYSVGRGYDVYFILGSQILKLPKSRGLIFNFQFGKDASRPGRPGDFRVPISAAQRMGWNLTGGYLGTAVDEIMKIGSWKTESVAKYYIGTTSSEKNAR